VTLELASPEAGKIALRGGSADIIVSDWLWVSRERHLGASWFLSLFERGRRRDGGGCIAAEESRRPQGQIAGGRGGPLDKSWLLLQGATEAGRHRSQDAGARQLWRARAARRKGVAGEFDANAQLLELLRRARGQGHAPAREHRGHLPRLGAKGSVAMIGYVFDDAWAAKNRGAVERFLE
jgi:NitT/TauT family transport system substrate-binding protein